MDIDWGTDDVAVAIEVVDSGESPVIRESLLEHTETRNKIIDECLEVLLSSVNTCSYALMSNAQLEAFLKQRHKELSKESNLSINVFAAAPRSLQSQVRTMPCLMTSFEHLAVG